MNSAQKNAPANTNRRSIRLPGQTLVQLGDDLVNPALDRFHFLRGEGGGVIVEAAVVGDAFAAHPDQNAVLFKGAVYTHAVHAVGGMLGGKQVLDDIVHGIEIALAAVAGDGYQHGAVFS